MTSNEKQMATYNDRAVTGHATPPLQGARPAASGHRFLRSPRAARNPQEAVTKSGAGVRLTALILASLALTLTACGFQLRGEYNVPFASVYVAAPGTSQVAQSLRRELANGPAKLMTEAKAAEAQLNITEEKRDRIILSLSGAGKVREYQLKLTVRYQLAETKGTVAIPTSEILLQRILTYDDAQIIAKQQEEALLYRDMERDATAQILRRMTAIKRPAAG